MMITSDSAVVIMEFINPLLRNTIKHFMKILIFKNLYHRLKGNHKCLFWEGRKTEKSFSQDFQNDSSTGNEFNYCYSCQVFSNSLTSSEHGQ